ncbi:MAG TPA: ABC transporter substrate-binding protein, partial [Stellaceae bacterium]|nr:ABC transporter substrate-binding protein [Stellaceae bacterium]
MSRNSTYQQDLIAIAEQELARGRIHRRDFLWLTAALGAVPALGLGPASAQTRDLTIANFGGEATKHYTTAWTDPFTIDTGVKVKIDGGGPLPGKIKSQVDAKNVIWDVADGDGYYSPQLGPQGYLEPIDYTIVDRKNVWENWAWPYAVNNYTYSYVLAYDTTKVKGVPSWADFFDTKKFPQKRSIIGWPTTGLVEMALIADGVPADKLYPLDLDRAFKKLATIKDRLVFWNSGAESQQLLASGQAPICFCWDTRVSVMLADKDPPPVAISWAQNITTADILVVPKGSKHKEAAMKFIALATKADAQARLAKAALLSPINTKAAALIDKSVLPQLAVGHSD